MLVTKLRLLLFPIRSRDAPHCAGTKAAGTTSPLTSILFLRFPLPLGTCPHQGRGWRLQSPDSKLEKSLSNIPPSDSSHGKTPSCEFFPETRPCKHGGSTRTNISRTVIPAVITAFAQTPFIFFPPCQVIAAVIPGKV